MSKREPITKAVRFEVFKRDHFTCQYCGAKAPDAVLNVDHIRPVADGGDSGIMNLITACFECNNGKGARRLDDRSAVERQRAQIEELETRREQLEMMLQWRDQAEQNKIDTVEAIGLRIETRAHFYPNESGMAHLRRWLQRYSVAELLAAVDASFDAYMRFNGDKADLDSWELAFKKIPVFASANREAVEKPYIHRLLYIQGILRRRFKTPRVNYIKALEEYVLEDGATPDMLETAAKKAPDWDQFCDMMDAEIRGRPDGE